MPRADERTVNRCKELVRKIQEWASGPDPTRREAFGPTNLEPAMPELRLMTSLVAQVAELDLATMAPPFASVLMTFVNQAATFAEKARVFAPVAGAADQLAGEIAAFLHQQAPHVMPILALFRGQTLSEHAAAAQKARNQIQDQAETLLKDVEATKEEATRSLAAVNELAKHAGVSAHATHFHEQATEHENASRRWLIASAVLFALILVVAGFSANYYLNARKTDVNDVQLVFAKAVFFAVLVSALVASNRNYRAHRHNYVVNKHRENALASFRTFVSGTVDEQIRNAILLQATTSIYSPQVSGYVTNERDTEGMPQIVEIVRSMSGKGNKAD